MNIGRKEAILAMKQVLIKRRDALRQALSKELSPSEEMDEIGSQLAEVESRELERIDGALELMRKGEYGECEGCGAIIPMARLNALPYATRCIKCQRDAERRGNVSDANPDWSRLLDASSQADAEGIIAE